MPEHELEQIKGALAQVLFEEIGLDIRDALELTDRFYGEIATSLQSGDSIELADFGYFSLRDGFSSSDLYGSGRYWRSPSIKVAAPPKNRGATGDIDKANDET
jgi:hypothetical protein